MFIVRQLMLAMMSKVVWYVVDVRCRRCLTIVGLFDGGVSEVRGSLHGPGSDDDWIWRFGRDATRESGKLVLPQRHDLLDCYWRFG